MLVFIANWGYYCEAITATTGIIADSDEWINFK